LLETELASIGAVTIHPSAILRLRDSDERADALAAMASDLGTVAGAMSR
jgi:hypothetical protein